MNMHIKKLLLITLLLLDACSVGTAYKRPETPQPAAWANSPQTTQNWPDKNWWTEFSSPELTALMTAALQNNYDLKAAVARIHEADAQLKIAGASLFPSLDAVASADRSQSSSSHSGTTATTTGTTTGNRIFVGNTLSASLQASYELDFWGKNRAATAAAAALADASRYDRETVLLTITTSVANTYFDLLATETRLQAAQNNLKATQRLLQSFNKRFQQGLVSALDVAQEENVLAAQQVTIPPLVLEVQQDKNALAVLVGKLPEGFQITGTPDNFAAMTVPQILPGLPSGLLARRPDVAEAEADLISAHENITVARAAFFPDITLTVEGGYQSVALSSLFKTGGQFFDLGAGLTQPIFHGGALSGQLEYNKAQYDELLQNYQKTVISAFADTENALTANAQDAELAADQYAATQTAQKAYGLSQQQFHEGIVDITSVLNTQRSLFTAEDAMATAELARLEAAVSLYAALGRRLAKIIKNLFL